eukprot:m.56514 g.56514  ORF g.56514 m.56514 type:complete len:530 (+) comp9306_c0_seq1:294-1883(+)
MKPAALSISVLAAVVMLLLSASVHMNSQAARRTTPRGNDLSADLIESQKEQIRRLTEQLSSLQHGAVVSHPDREFDVSRSRSGPTTGMGIDWHSPPKDHPAPKVVVGLGEVESTHTCYGRTYNKDYWIENTCMYHNMLYDVSKDEFVYVAHSEATAKKLRDSGDLVVSTYPQGFSARVGPVLEEGKLAPTVITREEAKSRFGDKAVVELSNVHTIYESYNAENFGHFLTDELYPAFSALSSFDRVEPDVQLLRRPTKTKWRYSCDWQVANWGEGQGKKCDLNYEMLTPLMSTNPVDKLREYSTSLLKKHVPADKQAGAVLQFRVAVSGFGMLADHCDDPTTHGRRIGSDTQPVHHNCNRGRQLQLINFKKWTMHMIGLDPNLQPKKQRVLIWDRAASDYKANRKVKGLPELKARIEKELKVEVMLYEQWLGKPAKYQLETMAMSTVFVTGVGSGSHIGWYLPRGGTMVRVCNQNAEPTHMEWHIMNYMPHFQVEYVEANQGLFDQEEVMAYVTAGLNRYALENNLPLVA